MKARYKGKESKSLTISGETIVFHAGRWVTLPTIAFLNRVKLAPTVFDVVYDYDIRPYLKYNNNIRFGARTIRCGHKPTIRALDRMKSLTRQAAMPEKGIVIYRVVNYSATYLEGYLSLQSMVHVLCKRHKGGIGDIIMTLPAMEAIKNRYENYSVDFACPREYMCLLDNVPFINKVYDVNKVDESKYEIVYDMTRKCIRYEGSTQPDVKLNRTEIFANIVDIQHKVPRTKLFLSLDEIDAGISIDFERTASGGSLVGRGSSVSDKLVIGICFDSSAKVRSYYYPELLLSKIANEYSDAIILCFQKKSKYHVSNKNVLNIIDFNLRDIMVLISRCDLFFGSDTGLSHIASSLRVKTVWFFSHIDGKIRTRGYDTSTVVQVTPPTCPSQKPCWYEFPCVPNDASERANGVQCVIAAYPELVMPYIASALSTPCISVIVLCHNQFNLTRGCIERILRIKRYNDELILLDNGSTDETQEYFSKLEINGFRYIRKSENIGCVLGRNFTLKEAKGRFCWLLDNDQFIEDHSLQKIIETEGDFIGVEGWFIKDDGLATKYNKVGILNYVGAGGMFARRDYFEDVGYFDEYYNPAWFEDPDICFKATEKGYIIGLCDNAHILHIPHSTNATQQDFNSGDIWKRNRLYFTEKWSHLHFGRPVVSIVILTHNDSDSTIGCINSIYRNTKLNQFEIIVVDNGSNQDEKAKLEGFNKINLTYVFNDTNLMVAAGRNKGAEKANGEFILFLDNDMVIPPEWLNKILKNMDCHACVATAPKIIDLKKGKETVRFIGTILKDGRIQEVNDESICKCDFLPGGALFVNREIFNRFPFDEKFVFGVEDYDWCIKVRAAGLDLVNTLSVTFYHIKNGERTINQYDSAERKRKGSSYIEDSIRLFLYRHKDLLPNQWQEAGWKQWAIGKDNVFDFEIYDDFLVFLKEEVARVYPDEIAMERLGTG